MQQCIWNFKKQIKIVVFKINFVIIIVNFAGILYAKNAVQNGYKIK